MDPGPRERGVQTICLLLLSALAVAAALYWLRAVMVPFVLAVFIAYGLSPLVDLSVRRLRFPRALAVAGTLALAFLLLLLLGALISASVGQLASNAENFLLDFGDLRIEFRLGATDGIERVLGLAQGLAGLLDMGGDRFLGQARLDQRRQKKQ